MHQLIWQVIKLSINPKYKKTEIVAGDLNIPVSFFEFKANDGPEPGEVKKVKLFECFCLAYNPSVKDMEILNTKGTREGLTIKIRDPHQDYIPTNKHKVVIDDYRISTGKLWEIVNVAPDFENSNFVKIVLGTTS